MQNSQGGNVETDASATLNNLLKQFTDKPDDALLCNQIGVLYFKIKKYRYARAYFEKACQLKPDLQSAFDYITALSTIEQSKLQTSQLSETNKHKYPDLHAYNNQQTILFIADYLYPPVGGAEKSALTFLKELALDGHRCIAVCKGDGNVNNIVYNNITINYLNNPAQIEQVILQAKPSLILTQQNWAFYGISLARKYHIPGILFIRSLEFFCASPVEFDRCDRVCSSCTVHEFNRTIKNKYSSTINQADAVICNSEFMRSITEEFYGRDSYVIYPPIEIADHEIENCTGQFIMMNQPEYYKGGDLFFEIARQLSDLKFMTVGRGKYETVSNCINYGQTNPLLFLQHAKLLLIPSLWPEPFGRIAVEAMLNGIPVIASNTGGLKEIIEDSGILIDNYLDIYEWVKVIRSVLSDHDLYARLSDKSKEQSLLFQTQFQMDKLRPIIDDVLELTSNSSDRRILDFYNKRYESGATYSFLFNHRRERLEGLCNMVKQGEFFLDIGCADGAHMEVLHQRKIYGIGIDVSIPNIIRGLKIFPHLNFIHGFAEKIPFTDDFFDVAIMGDILEHLRDPRSVLLEVFRVAKSIAVCVPIGEKTVEHISPYTTIDSIPELFDGLDVSINWFTHDGKKISRDNVTITESKPWVYCRIDRNSKFEVIITEHDTSLDTSTDTIHEQVRDEWDGRYFTRDFQEITRFHATSRIIKGPSILEMACGNGDLSVVIARAGHTLHGIDIMSNGIEWAIRTARAQGVADKVTFEVRDAAHSNFPDNHFDTVIIPELIEHIKDPHAIITEALRVVKPGGMVLISVPDGQDPNPDHIRFFCRETLRIELSQFTHEITWHKLPFKRWLIVTFNKPISPCNTAIRQSDRIRHLIEVEKDAPVQSQPLPGFNIIGPVETGNEFSARIRGFANILLECGYPVVVKNISLNGQQNRINPLSGVKFTDSWLPYSINCFCMDPLLLNNIFSCAPQWLRLNNRLNICLPDISSLDNSADAIMHLNRMDSILVQNEHEVKVIRDHNQYLQVIKTIIPPFLHRKGYFQRINFGIRDDATVVITFIDIQQTLKSQNIDCIIDTFNKLDYQSKLLVIVIDCTFGINNDHLNALKKMVQSNPFIKLYEGMIGREDTQSLFHIADIGVNGTLTNAPSPWILEMMSNQKPVIALSTPALTDWINDETTFTLKNFQCIPDRPATVRLDMNELLEQFNTCFSNKQLCKDKGYKAYRNISSTRQALVNGGIAPFVDLIFKKADEKKYAINYSKKHFSQHFRILFLNRKDVFSKPGDETIVMEQLKISLECKGHTVETSCSYPEVNKKFDIIHVFNAALSVYTDSFAARAITDGIPLVITPLQEDSPRYMNKSLLTFRLFKKYIDMGQPEGFFDKQYEFVRQQQAAPFITSPLALTHAAAVLVSGMEEASVIQRYFPSAKIKKAPVGFSFNTKNANPDMFINQYGIKDFILCVGRFENRKNQLMLLKALEYENVPLVFIGDNANNQPAYLQLCKSFKRKGSTLFIENVSEEMLASAYSAARVHCLPSWYELPGLSTIEAVSYGCPVVQSSWGTINDYCKDFLISCEPDDHTSIKNAVFKAFDKERNATAASNMGTLTWDHTADQIIDIYRFALENGNNTDEPERLQLPNAATYAKIDPSLFMESVTRLVENQKFREAIQLYDLQRHLVENIPGIGEFDMLINKIKSKIR